MCQFIQVGGRPNPTALQTKANKHLDWICRVMGVPVEDLVLLDVQMDLGQLFFGLMMRGEPRQIDLNQTKYSLSMDVVHSFETEPSNLPLVVMDWAPGTEYARRSEKGAWRSTWQDSPVALRLKGLTHPVVVLRAATANFYGDQTDMLQAAVVTKQDAAEFLKLVETASSGLRESVVHFHGVGAAPRRDGSWDEVVLGAEGEMLLRKDFETFWDRREWFQRQQLPYRRGYLLHGPPGNGKTSCIRAMLSRKGISAHSIHLHLPDVDDSDLLQMFAAASKEAPALVVLEDIDRCFAQKADKDDEPRVHLQTLLNCLDGVSTSDGVVVVATANNPEVLDSAILRRPGRFDRVVEFPNPAAALRQKYFSGKLNTLTAEEMNRCVEKAKGFSFAQLQEAYILAGQQAYDEGRNITGDDLAYAVETLKETMHRADRIRTEARGFKVAG